MESGVEEIRVGKVVKLFCQGGSILGRGPFMRLGRLSSRFPLTSSGLERYGARSTPEWRNGQRAFAPCRSKTRQIHHRNLAETKAGEIGAQSSHLNFPAQTAKRRCKAGRDGSFTSIRDSPQMPYRQPKVHSKFDSINLVNYFINPGSDTTCPDLQLYSRRS